LTILPLLLACAHHAATQKAPPVAPEVPPILPAPEADIYAAAGKGTPRDPLVARAAEGLPWDEALSGAAGALALAADRAPEIASARWAAWRAGYPYPVRSLSYASEAEGGYPEALVGELRSTVRPGDQVGLARARVGQEDRWVALIARVSVSVAPFARHLDHGEALALSGAGVVRYHLTSPTGHPMEGPMPASPALQEDGEWWLELYDQGGHAAVVAPVTVGMPAAPTPPLDLPGLTVTAPEQAMSDAMAALGEVRAVFDLPAVEADPTLDVLARAPLALAADAWDPASEKGRAKAAGYADGGAVTCAAGTIPLCLDAILRTGAGREVLLDPDYKLAGGGATVSVGRVRLVLYLATD